MQGRDVIGIAKTGSGKTIAYLLPLIPHILDQPHLAQVRLDCVRACCPNYYRYIYIFLVKQQSLVVSLRD